MASKEQKNTNISPSNLTDLGWDSFFAEQYRQLKVPGSVPARISSEQKHSYQVFSQYGEIAAEISGKLRYQAQEGGQYPAVGDWVVLRRQNDESKGIIQAVLPRKSKFSRKVAGARTEEQVVAANIDTVFIVSGLDGGRNFSLRRIERYLTIARNSGASPANVLNKIDLCPDVNEYVRSVEAIAPDVPIHPVSATERRGLDVLRDYTTRGKTAAFIGPSGVGKSALINALLGVERQEIREVRESDSKGRHTTTRRELILLPGSGIVIDTPGMREIQLWADGDNPQNVFTDIEALAVECRFSDCTHRTETGCAVNAAIQRGELDAARLESYQKLQRELDHLASRQSNLASIEEKVKWKKIAQWARQIQKYKRK